MTAGPLYADTERNLDAPHSKCAQAFLLVLEISRTRGLCVYIPGVRNDVLNDIIRNDVFIDCPC